MLGYVVRRLLWMVLALVAVSAITFLIFYVLPSGDPAQRSAGTKPSPQRIEAVRRRLALDKPAIAVPWRDSQIRRYYERLLLHGDMGYSYESETPVADRIRSNLPATIQLAVGAMIVWLLVSVPLGVVSALKRRSLLDRVLMGVAVVALSAPVYWLGLVSLSLFDETLGVFPLLPAFDGYVPFGDDPGRWFASMLISLSADYIRTARAKGLSEQTVILRHALRNSLITVTTVIGLQLGALVSGVVITETIFGIAGFGALTVEAVNQRDYTLIQGVVLVAAAGYVIVNLAVDVVYALLNPRIRASGAR